MLGHPGKKLLFMGQDFGQWHEWDEKVSLDWYLAEEESHRKLQEYVRDLLHIYRKYPCLYHLTMTGTVSSGLTPMTATAAFLVLSVKMKLAKKEPAVYSKLHTCRSPGLPCRRSETL